MSGPNEETIRHTWRLLSRCASELGVDPDDVQRLGDYLAGACLLGIGFTIDDVERMLAAPVSTPTALRLAVDNTRPEPAPAGPAEHWTPAEMERALGDASKENVLLGRFNRIRPAPAVPPPPRRSPLLDGLDQEIDWRKETDRVGVPIALALHADEYDRFRAAVREWCPEAVLEIPTGSGEAPRCAYRGITVFRSLAIFAGDRRFFGDRGVAWPEWLLAGPR